MEQENKTHDAGADTNSSNKKLFAAGAVVLAGAAIAVGIMFYSSVSERNYAAIVNNEPITKQELAERAARTKIAYEAQGFPIDTEEMQKLLEERVLDEMINEKRLLQYAKSKGIKAEDELVAEQYDGIRDMFESEEEFSSWLKEQNLTADTLKSFISIQILMQSVVQEYAQGELDVSEIEITDLYERYKAQVEDMPPLELVREQLQEELATQKFRSAATRLLEELREKGNVKILL